MTYIEDLNIINQVKDKIASDIISDDKVNLFEAFGKLSNFAH